MSPLELWFLAEPGLDLESYERMTTRACLTPVERFDPLADVHMENIEFLIRGIRKSDGKLLASII